MAMGNLAPSSTTNPVPLPWQPKDIRVCLIGYHGALHEMVVTLSETDFHFVEFLISERELAL